MTLLLDTKHMAASLGVPPNKVHQLTYNDRIPLPVKIGLCRCPRWSVFELLDWMQAGCPRRTAWIEKRGWSGWARRYGCGLP